MSPDGKRDFDHDDSPLDLGDQGIRKGSMSADTMRMLENVRQESALRITDMRSSMSHDNLRSLETSTRTIERPGYDLRSSVSHDNLNHSLRGSQQTMQAPTARATDPFPTTSELIPTYDTLRTALERAEDRLSTSPPRRVSSAGDGDHTPIIPPPPRAREGSLSHRGETSLGHSTGQSSHTHLGHSTSSQSRPLSRTTSGQSLHSTQEIRNRHSRDAGGEPFAEHEG